MSVECPECSSQVEDGQVCGCGWSPPNASRKARARDDDPMADVRNLLAHHRAAKRPWPDCFADNVPGAAAEFVGLMEPQGPTERPQRVGYTADGEAKMRHPYRERLIGCLRIFLSLHPEEQAEIVDGVRGKAVPWRGEPLLAYRRICEEAERFRDSEYREKAIAAVLDRTRKGGGA